MAFWDYIFNKIEPEEGPDIRFGRFSDAYKDQTQYDSWDQSLDAFEKESYLESIRNFLDYLTDTELLNAKWWENEGRLHFQILQGSKKITGNADKNRLRAEAKIAKGENLNVGLLRRLIEKNYALKYSRYALDEDNFISLVFDTFLLDGSPYKLYYALKEVAINADKQDDLLVSEFALTPINTGHVESISEDEKKIKFEYFKKEIGSLRETIEAHKVHSHQFPEGIGYILLALCYKLDYLLAPEGMIMEAFERINRQYLANDQKSQLQKIAKVRQEIEDLYEVTEVQFNKELYRTTSTFGISSPVNQQQIKEHILSEIDKMDWFQTGKFKNFGLAVPGYIIGYALFNFAVPEPVRDFFHFYFRLTENQYFAYLGFDDNYLENGELNKKPIKKTLKRILEKNVTKYPFLKIDVNKLDYSSQGSFSKSYLIMISQLDLTKPA